MTYFNTNNESGEELKQSRRNASTQEQEVMEIFFAELRALTPSEVLSKIKNNYPLTSIRRAITNLTKGGFLKGMMLLSCGMMQTKIRWLKGFLDYLMKRSSYLIGASI